MPDKPRIPIFNWQFLLVLALVLVAFLIYKPFSPAAVQQRGMDVAEQFLAPVNATLTADPRFKEVSAHVVTNVTILIRCDVANEASFEDLVQIVHDARAKANTVCPIYIRAGLDHSANGGEFRLLEKKFEAKGKN